MHQGCLVTDETRVERDDRADGWDRRLSDPRCRLVEPRARVTVEDCGLATRRRNLTGPGKWVTIYANAGHA